MTNYSHSAAKKKDLPGFHWNNDLKETSFKQYEGDPDVISYCKSGGFMEVCSCVLISFSGLMLCVISLDQKK